MRTSKTVNDVTTYYYYDGSTLIAEETGGAVTLYIYDSYGMPAGFGYKSATSTAWSYFFYEKNLQGDIIGVYSSTGVKLISYTYDPWGVATVSYHNGGASTDAVNNNLTYRGYVYDSDLGLYYLISRYYDANTGRFINADSVMSGANGSLYGYNLYVYCFNNPINMSDSTGNWPDWFDDFCDWCVDTAEAVVDWFVDTAENIGEAVSDFCDSAVRTVEIVTSPEFWGTVGESIKDNATIEAGICLGIGFENENVEAISRIDIIGISYKNSELKIGHYGKSSLAINIGGVMVGPQNETYEEINSSYRETSSTVYASADISAGIGVAFGIGFHARASFSIDGFINDIADYWLSIF